MTAFTNYSKEDFKNVRADINAALAEVAKKYGMSSLTIGNITYDATSFNTKLTAIKPNDSSIPGTSPNAPTPKDPRELKWQKAFKSGCLFWGLAASDLGKTVTVSGNGKTYTGRIAGARARTDHNPIILNLGTGLLYCSVDMVKKSLNVGA